MQDTLDISDINFIKGENLIIETPRYLDSELILNKSGSKITNIPKVIWEMGIGGYYPLQKWIKDRKGRILDEKDIEHFLGNHHVAFYGCYCFCSRAD